MPINVHNLEFCDPSLDRRHFITTVNKVLNIYSDLLMVQFAPDGTIGLFDNQFVTVTNVSTYEQLELAENECPYNQFVPRNMMDISEVVSMTEQGIVIPLTYSDNKYHSYGIDVTLINPAFTNFSHVHMRLLDEEINAVGLGTELIAFPIPYVNLVCLKTAVNTAEQVLLTNKKLEMDQAKVKTLETIVKYFLKRNISVVLADNVLDVPKEKDQDCTAFMYKIAYVKDIDIPLFCDANSFDSVLQLYDDMIMIFDTILITLHEAEEFEFENLVIKKEVKTFKDFIDQFQHGTFEYELIAILLSLLGGLMITTCFCLFCYCAILRAVVKQRDARTLRNLANL